MVHSVQGVSDRKERPHPILTHGSLFSGIGGFDLAAQWMGWDNVFHCEIDPFCQKVLAHHFPNSTPYKDVTKFEATKYRGRIDVLSGGFPCQPFSVAGEQKGTEDDRHLWPSMCRIIREIQPRYVVGENVLGLLNWSGGLVFEQVCADLEDSGYEVTPYILPAGSVGAPHRRNRIWFVAHARPRDAADPNGLRLEHTEKTRNVQKSAKKTQSKGGDFTEPFETNGSRWNAPDTDSPSIERESIKEPGEGESNGRSSKEVRDWWEEFPTVPPVCGGDDGLPQELDDITFSKWRTESVKAYGNAIVPQVVLQIFKTIQENEDPI